jgi:hypothetical protein
MRTHDKNQRTPGENASEEDESGEVKNLEALILKVNDDLPI